MGGGDGGGDGRGGGAMARRMEEDEEERNGGAEVRRRAVHAALTHATYAAAAPLLPLLRVHSALHAAVALGAFALPPLLLPPAALRHRRAARCALLAAAPLPPLLLALRVSPPLALALAAAVAPPLAAAFHSRPSLPFFALALVHALLVPFALHRDHKHLHQTHLPPSPPPPPLPSVRTHPRLLLVLIAMLASAATSSYLRPLLVPYLAPDNTLSSYMRPALLFSLHAVAAFLAETLVPPLLTNHISLQTAVSLGILTSLAGLSLVHHSFLAIGLFFIAFGSSASLVLAVSHLAATTNQPLNSVTDPIAVLAARIFSCGEVLGILVAGILANRAGFQFAITVWYALMIVVALIVIVPQLVLRCCTPFAFLLATSSSTNHPPHERTPLLHYQTPRSSNLTFNNTCV